MAVSSRHSPSYLSPISVDVWFPMGAPLTHSLQEAGPYIAQESNKWETTFQRHFHSSNVPSTPFETIYLPVRKFSGTTRCSSSAAQPQGQPWETHGYVPRNGNLRYCQGKHKMPWWKLEVSSKILILGTQLLATSQGREPRTGLESLPVFLRVLKVIETFLRLWTNSLRVCISWF